MASLITTNTTASSDPDGLLDATAPLECDDEVIAERSPPAYRTGDLIARRYRIEGLLARGGMSDVYAGTDLGLKRPVALKVASGDSTGAEVASERLLREAKTLAGLRHPNLVTVLDQGRTLRGTAFIALERISGATLRQFLAENASLSWQTAVSIAVQIASGLEAIHSRGIVHCDLSPANVLVARSEPGVLTCKLIDFGLACRVRKPRQAPLHGTRSYLAPEGFVSGDADARLDLYALGVMLAEMLGPRAHGAPAVLARLVHSLRAADPKSRPASAAAVLDVLRPLAVSDTSAAALSRPLPTVQTPSRLAWSMVAIAIVVATGALISAVGVGGARQSAPVAAVRPPPPPVRAELQAFPVRIQTPTPVVALPARARPVVSKATVVRTEPRRELEAALLERRQQMFRNGIGGAEVIAVAGISFDPRQRSARVVYRRDNSSAELVEYWAVRDGRWQPLND